MDSSKKEEKNTGKDNIDQQSSSLIEEIFDGFSTEDKESGGKTIDLESAKKWFKQAKISEVTDDDIKSAFSKQAGSNKGVDLEKFKHMVHQIAKEKKLEWNELIEKMSAVIPPGGSPKGMMDSIAGNTPGKQSQKEDDKGAKGFQPGTGASAGQDETDSQEKDALPDLTKSPPDTSK